ncbi:MAG: tetratricopeptide repeat protein, partial [Kiritimatiellia bacterium]
RIYIYYPSCLAAAGILLKQGKLDEALGELKRFDPLPPDGPTAPYKARALKMHGDIYAQQGKKDMALASYKDALKTGLDKNDKDRVNKTIEELSK